MKNFIIIAFFIIYPTFIYAQIITDNAPINNYFQKIEFANLPEIETGKQGMLFFTSDTSYFNNFIRNKITHTINEIRSEYFRYKFKRNNYRYTNYHYTMNKIEYISDNKFKSFDDIDYVSVSASRNKRMWSWHHLKFILLKLDETEVYKIKISSNNKFITNNYKDDRALSFNNIRMLISSNDIELFNDSVSTADWTKYDTQLNYNFNDEIIKSYKLYDLIDLENIYCKPANDFSNILFYCPVLFK